MVGENMGENSQLGSQRDSGTRFNPFITTLKGTTRDPVSTVLFILRFGPQRT